MSCEPGKRNFARHHANHRHRRTVDPKHLADRVGGPTELLLPHLVADDHDRGRSRSAVGVTEVASERRSDSQQPEGVGGQSCAVVPGRNARRPDDVGGLELEGGQLLERALPVPELCEGVDPGVEVVLLGDVERGHVNDAVRLGERQPAQHRAVDDAEHRGGEADTQPQRDHRQQCRAWLAHEGPDGNSQLAHRENYRREFTVESSQFRVHSSKPGCSSLCTVKLDL